MLSFCTVLIIGCNCTDVSNNFNITCVNSTCYCDGTYIPDKCTIVDNPFDTTPQWTIEKSNGLDSTKLVAIIIGVCILCLLLCGILLFLRKRAFDAESKFLSQTSSLRMELHPSTNNDTNPAYHEFKDAHDKEYTGVPLTSTTHHPSHHHASSSRTGHNSIGRSVNIDEEIVDDNFDNRETFIYLPPQPK